MSYCTALLRSLAAKLKPRGRMVLSMLVLLILVVLAVISPSILQNSLVFELLSYMVESLP